MVIKPITLKAANEFVALHHRHNKPVVGAKFSISAYKDNVLVGVAICGRPISRYLDKGLTLEVYRVCTDGTKNATSFLYARCSKIGRLMGYEKIITYTLQSESGSSLKAIGGVIETDVTHKRQWNDSGKAKRNYQKVSEQLKFRWAI